MPKITFLSTGEIKDVPDGTSLLEYSQSTQAGIPFGCTVGSCSTCTVVVTEGADTLDPASEDELDTLEGCEDIANIRLACCLTIHGDVSLHPVDEKPLSTN